MSYLVLRTALSTQHSALSTSLSIHFPEYWVDAADDRDEIGDQAADGHHRQRLEVDERWGTNVAAVGLAGAIADDVEADLALRRLDAGVDLTDRRLEALADELEVVDQSLHARRQLGARWQSVLAIIRHDRPRRQAVERLARDLVTLVHLRDADEVAIVGVAG